MKNYLRKFWFEEDVVLLTFKDNTIILETADEPHFILIEELIDVDEATILQSTIKLLERLEAREETLRNTVKIVSEHIRRQIERRIRWELL